MRVKIEIDGVALDLLEGTDESFYITKQLNDLHNLQNRQADFTRDIQIPSTPDNLKLLDLVENERSGNKSYLCNIYLDNILVIPSGKLLLLEYSNNNITGVIFSGNYELFDAIPDTSIKKLDFSAFNFPWTIAGITGIGATTSGAVAIDNKFLDYDSLDNGVAVPSSFDPATFNVTDINNYGFGFYAKTIIEYILNNVGFELDDTFLSAYFDYNNLVVFCPIFIAQKQATTYNARVENGNIWTYDDTYLGLPTRLDGFNNVIIADPSWSNVNQEYTIPFDGTFVVTYSYSITYDAIISPAEITIRQNGGYVNSDFWSTPQTNTSSIITQTFNATAGDLIYIEVVAGYRNISQFDTVDIASGSIFDIIEQTEGPGGEVVISDWLPDINQRQFLRDFLKIFNASIDSSAFSKAANIIPWNDFILQTPVDITHNLDIEQPITEELSLRGYYQNSIMSYSNDELVRTDINHVVNFSGDESVRPSGTILNVGFSGSDLQGNFDIIIPYIKASYRTEAGYNITTGTNVFTFANDTTFKNGDYIRTNIGTIGTERLDRISVAASKIQGTIYDNMPVTVTNGDVEIISWEAAPFTPRIGVLAPSATQNPLTDNNYNTASLVTNVTMKACGFGITMNYIYTTYYRNLFNALQTPKILLCWMVFTPVEFSNLDLSKPVTIGAFNGTFYINKIEQYKIGTPCRVELIRINDALQGAISR